MAQLETRFEHAFDMPYRVNQANGVRGGRLLVINGASDSAAPKPRVIETTDDAGTQQSVGAALADKALNEDVTVVRRGVQKLVASGVVARGELVYPASAGRVRGAAGPGAAIPAGTNPYGIALGATTAADQTVWVKVL
jgi:hypothetical protein